MAKDVTFRRIHGRIVPIKNSGARKDNLKQGSALSIAGAATAVTAGDLAARATKNAAHFKINSTVYAAKAKGLISKIRKSPTLADKFENAGQMAFGFKLHPTAPKSAAFEKIAMKNALKSSGFKVMRKGLYRGGLVTSTALLGIGFKKLYEGISGKKADTKEEIIATASGAGATFALSTSYAHRKAGGGLKHILKAVKFGLRAAKIKV